MVLFDYQFYSYKLTIKLLFIGELLVILELCQYGSIYDYLIVNKDDFVDELLNKIIIGESRTYENINIEKTQFQEQNK